MTNMYTLECCPVRGMAALTLISMHRVGLRTNNRVIFRFLTPFTLIRYCGSWLVVVYLHLDGYFASSTNFGGR
jgi:hypothetical protein